MEVRIITNAYKLYKDARDASWRCLINTGAAEEKLDYYVEYGCQMGVKNSDKSQSKANVS